MPKGHGCFDQSVAGGVVLCPSPFIPPSTDEGEKSDTEIFPEQQEQAILIMRMEVQDALKRLSCLDRTIVEWCIMEGMALREVAKELGISATAVHKRLKHALDKLREWLSDRLTKGHLRRDIL